MDEQVQPGERRGVGEHLRRDALAIERAVGAVDVCSVFGSQGSAHAGLTVRDLVPDAVGIKDAGAGLGEAARDRALATAGGSDQAHDKRAGRAGAPGA